MTKKVHGDFAFLAENLKGTTPEEMFSGALSFLRRKYSRDLRGVDLAVTGIPLDIATSNRSGARLGPRAVRAASSNLAWARQWPWEFDPFERIAVVDYGDCSFDYGRPETIVAEIEAHITEILDAGAATLSIGGDHFVSYPILRAYAKKHGPVSLLHFDAHSDTWEDEPGRIDHGTMFFHAVNEGLVDPARSVQVGLRTTNEKPMGFNILDARYVHKHDTEEIVAEIKRHLGDHKVYLTFDIDCLDPAFAPGTGTPVAGGLSSFQALEIIRGLRDINLIGMDIVEVAPAYDVSEITALAAATLACEFICVFAANR
ncbi:MAG: agmatinase [Gammaproteobacteria bacterium]|nr:agmatinase [Gammaproteobacteria bacterium]